MNIFLLASSYLEDTLCGIFKNIDKLIMLRENHMPDIRQTIQPDYDIVLYNDMSKTICDADLILLIYDETYSLFLKEKIAQLNIYNKKMVSLCYEKNHNTCFSDWFDVRNIPTILLLEHGEYTQIEKAEFAINKCLNEQRIKVYQMPSELCNLILHCNEIHNYINFDNINYNAAELQVFTIQNFHNVQVNQSNIYVDFFYLVKPDIVITYTEANNFNYLDYTNILNYRYNLEFSYIIKSDYYHWDDSYVRKLNHSSRVNDYIDPKYCLTSDIDYFQFVKSILGEPSGVTIL